MMMDGFINTVLAGCKAKSWPFALSDRESLILKKTYLEKRDFLCIASLLESSPNLELFVHDYCQEIFDPEVYEIYDYDESQNWILQKRHFKCLQFHLKTVEITYLSDWSEAYDSFVQILLKNALVLEKVVINEQRNLESESLVQSQTLLDVAQKLLSLPRSSSKAQIILNPAKQSIKLKHRLGCISSPVLSDCPI